jgi:hypothetical protein
LLPQRSGEGKTRFTGVRSDPSTLAVRSWDIGGSRPENERKNNGTSRLLKKAILAFFNSEIEKRGFRFPHVSERFETARKRRSIPGSLGRLFFNSLLA